MNLFDLTAKIVLDTGEYERGIKNAKYAAEDFTDSVDDMAGSIEGSDATLEDLADSLNESAEAFGDAGNEIDHAGDEAGSAGGKFKETAGAVKLSITDIKSAVDLAVQVYDMLKAMVYSNIEYGDKIAKDSAKIGFTEADYQQWQSVLGHYGTDIDAVRRSVRTLRTEASRGNAAFKKLGISVEDANKWDNGKLFEQTITALQAIEDPTEKIKLAREVFGQSYDELMPLLKDTTENTSALIERWKELGSEMSTVQLRAAEKITDLRQDSREAWQGVKNDLSYSFYQIVEEYEKSMADAAILFQKTIEAVNQRKGFQKSFGSVDEMKTYVAELNAELESLGDVPSVWSDPYGLYRNERQRIKSLNEEIEAWNEIITSQEEKTNEYINQLLDARAQMYVETYNTIRQNVAGYFGYFEESGGIAEMEDSDFSKLSENLQSQIDYMTQYGNAITRLREYAERSDAPISGLIDYITSAGKEGAQVAVELQKAIDSGDTAKVDALAEKYAELQQTEDSLAGTITKAVGGYDELAEAAQGDIEKIKSALNELVGSDYVVNILLNDSVTGAYTPMGNAGGDPYIRQHNTVRLLHEGERVMTKRENEEYMNSQHGGNDADVQPIKIVVQSVLDGDVIGETAYNYSYNKDRRYGT